MNKLTILILAVVAFFLCSCAIFEEKPVTNEKITITSPGNLTTVTSLNVTFIWSEILNSAPFQYNIQVASPDFISPSYYAVDTNTTGTKYTKVLLPGSYACRVRVFNGSTQSQYTTINFVLDTAKRIAGIVNLTSPSNGVITKSRTLTLSWDAIAYATRYNIQVYVLDSIGNLGDRVKNTDTLATQVSYTLVPGKYKWQVRAYNTASTTEPSYRTFSIDTINSISNETTILLSPADDIYSKSKIQTFKWQKINYASTYKLEIAVNDFSQPSNVFYSNFTDKDTITSQIPFDSKFQWRVTASNAGGNAKTSDARTITIITSTLPSPILLTPIQNETTTSSIVRFSWSKAQNTVDSLIIFRADSITRAGAIGQVSPSSAAIYDLNLNAGIYFWKVRSTDLAGNVSAYSTVQKFFVP